MQRTEVFSEHAGTSDVHGESTRSAVSWAAVIAGTVIGAALMGTLITGGAGLGLLMVSPWDTDGASGITIATGTVVWLLLTQIIAYGIAGYVTGRLRTKWTGPGSDEIYFRDTAHGFLVWALSFVVGMALFGSMVMSAVSGTAKVGTQAVSEVAGQVAGSENTSFSMDYFTDALLRPDEPGMGIRSDDVRREVAVILGRSVAQGEVSESDQAYLVSVVSRRAGISETEAQERLGQISEQAKKAADSLEIKAREAADDARKAAATFSLWAFASLLLGAFVASFAATIGGRARDL